MQKKIAAHKNAAQKNGQANLASLKTLPRRQGFSVGERQSCSTVAQPVTAATARLAGKIPCNRNSACYADLRIPNSPAKAASPLPKSQIAAGTGTDDTA